MDKLIVYTDGGARGNPGPAGIGVVFYNSKKEIVKKFGKYVGDDMTNNQAEYIAVIEALAAAKELGVKELDFFLDSELVVKQLNGEYKVKNKELSSLFVKIWNATQSFSKVKYRHVPREENKEADRLVNDAIDREKR
ncbi:MAG: ribonuclease HI family protein [Patescibacteria group bacterium]